MGKIIRIPSRTPRSGKSIKGPTKRPKKGPKKAAAQQRRESSSSLSSPANLSDDEGYSGVDDVSDSEDDDEEHVFAAEEEHIISDQRRHKKGAAASSPRPSSDLEDDEAADADDDDSGNEETSTPQKGMQNVHGGADFENAIDDSSSESESWNGFSVDDEQPPYPVDTTPAEQSGTPVERHVRFAGLPDSDSDSDETDEDHDDFFPDIFISQDSLDSNFRREIERDDDNSDISLTYWDHTGAGDFEGFSDPERQEETSHIMSFDGLSCVNDDDMGDHMLVAMGVPTDPFGNSHSNVAADTAARSTIPDVPLQEENEESDGYESDGETTEEDEPMPIRLKTLTPARRAASGGSSDSEPSQDNGSGEDKSPVCRLPTGSRKKPICVLNPHTRKMMIFTPKKKLRFDLSPSQLPSDYFSQPTTTQSSPIKPGHVLFPMGVYWPTDDALGSLMVPQMTQANDPFLSRSLSFAGPASESSSYPDDEEEDAEEKNLDINDFIMFEDGDSDGEEPNDDNADDDNADGVETPSRRPTVAPSATSDSNVFSSLLHHFTKRPNTVGAFRLNQTNQKLILNGEATQESLAFSNPYFHGTLRGIKNGSLNGAATPLTPERRHKKAFAKSPAEAVALKRKASAMAGSPFPSHKKQRSIPDVGRMHI